MRPSALLNTFVIKILGRCLNDPKSPIQEQALNILCNIASNESGIDMLFDHFSQATLMKVVGEALESDNEEVMFQVRITN